MLCRATQDRWVMVERSDKMWSTGEGNGKPLQYSCLENPMNSMKRQKDRTLKDELPSWCGGGLVAKSCLTLATPWTIALQAPPSLGFSRQEYWSGFHFLLQGMHVTQGSNLSLPHCRQILYPLSYQGSTPWCYLPVTEKVKHVRHAEFLGPNSCGDGQNVHSGCSKCLTLSYLEYLDALWTEIIYFRQICCIDACFFS